MNKLLCWTISLAVAMWIGCMGNVAHAQNTSTAIRVLDASGVEGISGVVLLINPGDARKSQALVTNAEGEAVTHGLQCEICTVTAFDLRGRFASRTTEFSSSSPSFSLVMQLRPLIDTVGDPKATSIELVIHDARGEPLSQKNVVVRPLVMGVENNEQLSVQRTDGRGRLAVQLRPGKYAVATLNGGSASEARFQLATAKEQCSVEAATCIVAWPQSSHHLKPVSLQVSSMSVR
jgi:hypothetical protein